MARKKQKSKAWTKFKFGRKTGSRGKPKKRILIVCEGEKTEPNYFRSFRVTSATVIVKELGKNTSKLVLTTIAYQDDAIKNMTPYDQIWCVFDRDSFKLVDFNKALKLASTHNINVAYSNEAFEIWYLLHFSYLSSAVSRKNYALKLCKCLGKDYKKNSKTIYDELIDKQGQAIKNSKKLIASYSPHDPAEDNPCTNVFKLVEELNKNI